MSLIGPVPVPSSSSQFQFQDDNTFDIIFQYYIFIYSPLSFFVKTLHKNKKKCYLDFEKQAVEMMNK